MSKYYPARPEMSKINGHGNRTSDQSDFSCHGKSFFVSVCGIQLGYVMPSNAGIFQTIVYSVRL